MSYPLLKTKFSGMTKVIPLNVHATEIEVQGNHNIEGEYTINRINSEGEKFLLIDLELYYNNMMITCISQHNKTLRILQFKLSEKLGHR
jgi:hypothetical protein